MSSDREEYDMVCQKAVTLIVDLCLHNSSLLDQETCKDYLFLLSSHSSDRKELGKEYNELLIYIGWKEAAFLLCFLRMHVLPQKKAHFKGVGVALPAFECKSCNLLM